MLNSSITVRWPQYKKFSSPLDRRGFAKKIAIGGAVALVFAMSLLPEADQLPAVPQAARHVTLPRVVIVAKRERPESVVMTDSLRITSTYDRQVKSGSSAAKVAPRRD
jgi:hypothetical protein